MQIIEGWSASKKMRVCELEFCMKAECRTIRKWLREMADVTISEYIHRLRMEMAGLLLRGEADITVRQVSRLLGMKDPEKFCKRFKESFGFTPSVYRRLYFEESRDGKHVLRGGVCFQLSLKKNKIHVLRSGGEGP